MHHHGLVHFVHHFLDCLLVFSLGLLGELDQMQLLILQLFEIVVSPQSSHLEYVLEIWEIRENLLQIPVLETVDPEIGLHS